LKIDPENIPVYVIVELLIRVSYSSEDLGDYKTHVFHPSWVVINTSKGRITFSNSLVFKHWEHPGKITDEELLNALTTFERKSSQ
jgi:hypothetical protein